MDGGQVLGLLYPGGLFQLGGLVPEVGGKVLGLLHPKGLLGLACPQGDPWEHGIGARAAFCGSGGVRVSGPRHVDFVRWLDSLDLSVVADAPAVTGCAVTGTGPACCDAVAGIPLHLGTVEGCTRGRRADAGTSLRHVGDGEGHPWLGTGPWRELGKF